MLQMSLIYAWTAVAKLEPVWLSGDTLNKLVAAPDVRTSVLSVGAKLGFSVQETFQLSAWAVMLGEFFAAGAFLIRPLRKTAFFIVPWFHIMVEWIGFDIELFSYYMLLLNLTLLSPSSFWTWPEIWYQKCVNPRFSSTEPFNSSITTAQSTQVVADHVVHEHTTNNIMIKLGLSIIAGLIATWSIAQINLEGSDLASYVTGILLTLSIFGYLFPIRLENHSIKLFIMLSFCLASVGHYLMQKEVSSPTFRFDYYRMWGGDLKRRGQDKQALEVYQKANRAQEKHLPARFIPAGELAIKLGQRELGLQYLKKGTYRRLGHLESQIERLLTAQPSDKKSYRNDFERAARSAQQAQQKLYRAYLRSKDPRAREAQEGLEIIQQMIQQTRAQL